MNEVTQVGRLALRHEGDNWVAYYALSDSMQDAIFLGSIHMGALVGHPRRKQLFMDMMKDIVSDIIQQNTGERPTWNEPEAAPEHERTGHG
jgi:hypothetical protein